MINTIINYLKKTSPVFIIINVVVGIILLIIAIMLLRNYQTSAQRIIGWVCLIFSILNLFSAVISTIFTYFIF